MKISNCHKSAPIALIGTPADAERSDILNGHAMSTLVVTTLAAGLASRSGDAGGDGVSVGSAGAANFSGGKLQEGAV